MHCLRLTFLAASGAALLGLLAIDLQHCQAQPLRAIEEGKKPDDVRLKPLKDLHGYFPLEVPASKRGWERRAWRVKRQIQVANGLWPMPTATALNPVVHGLVDRGDYTVERAYFESFPGFYVTGSLYRPTGDTGKNKDGRRAAVLCPHGHWNNGRFYDSGPESVLRSIVDGAERFAEAGRSPLQARCAQLARMGCVVFLYDMIGYADSVQISYELAHRFGKQRPEMNTVKNWGLFSTQAESNLQSVMGMQTYNSIRAVDFLETLDDVDPQRIAVTGSSGGGTQTMLLAALEPRIKVSVPAVMVSTAMQGGCTCENCTLLRVGTGNVEFAALFAPRPQAVLCADDWTVEMKTKGFPELQKIYGLYGAEKNVLLNSRTHFKHNYNFVNRAVMYAWLNKHLKLGLKPPVVEGDCKRLTTEEMTVWTGGKHPRPKAADPDFERKLLSWWKEDTEKQLAALTPRDAASLEKYKTVVGDGVDAVIGRRLPAAKDINYDARSKRDDGSYLTIASVVNNTAHGEQLPVLFLHPKQWNGQLVIWLHEKGKAGLYDANGKPSPAIAKLLAAGVTVAGVDLFQQGEFLDGKEPELTRKVENPREAPAFTFGYNHSVFAQRVHDVLTTIAFVQNHELAPKQVDLVGLGNAAGWAIAARAQAGDAVDRLAVDVRGFRFGKQLNYRSPMFLPGGARYGDIPGMLALAAPAELWLGDTGEKAPEVTAAAYNAAGGKLTYKKGSVNPDDVVDYLLKK